MARILQAGTLEELVSSAIRCKTEDAALGRVVRIYKHDPKRVVEIATTLIGSHQQRRREIGVWLLAELGYPRKPLLERRIALLKSACLLDRSTRVRARAIRSLGLLKCESATKIIRPLSRHKSAAIRLAVAQALTADESHETFVVLKQLAGDGDARIREWATFNLGLQPAVNPAISGSCVKTLEARLHDSSQRVRLEAIRALLVRGEFSSLRSLRLELKRHRPAQGFFDHWFDMTMKACEESGFDDVLTGCFEELILSLNLSVKPLVAWS